MAWKSMTSLKACFIISLSFLKKKVFTCCTALFYYYEGKNTWKITNIIVIYIFCHQYSFNKYVSLFCMMVQFRGWKIWQKLQNLRNVIIAKINPSWEDANFVRMCITILVFNSSLIDLSFRVISSSSSDSSWLQVILASISWELSDAQDS